MTAQTIPDADMPDAYNHPAEREFLRTMIWSGVDRFTDVADQVNPTVLTHPLHRILYTEVCELRDDDGPTDPADVVQALTVRFHEKGRLTSEMALLLADMTKPSSADPKWYANKLADVEQKRQLIALGQRITQIGSKGKTHAEDDPAARALALFTEFEEKQPGSEDIITIGDMIIPGMAEIEKAGQGVDLTNVVPTGFLDLDRLMAGGNRLGQSVVVAGRPGIGKSTVALDFARAAFKHGKPACIFSMEMGKQEIFNRLISAECGIPITAVNAGQLTEGNWDRVAEKAAEILADAPLFLDDTPNQTVESIRAKARRLKRRHDLKLIVVDYLQLMTSPKRVENRQQEVTLMSRGLKLLAKELDVVMVIVSQLNRGPEQRTDKRPQLSDLRESGSIEQDADTVLLLSRDDYYDNECARAGEADFIIAKHRTGPTDTITVAAQLHLSRFVDMAADSTY